MRDILDRPIGLGDLVIYNGSYYLVIANDSLFYSNDMEKYPKIINNIDNNLGVVKVTNYDNEEMGVREFFKNAYMKYEQSLIGSTSENIKIGDVFNLGIDYYIYMGMATLNSTWEDNGKQSKSDRVHTFYQIGDFCEAKNIIFQHKGLDIDFLLQYTTPNFKTCKDLNKFLNKVVKIDNFYVTDNSFNNRIFKKSMTKNGKLVLVTNELEFDMV